MEKKINNNNNNNNNNNIHILKNCKTRRKNLAMALMDNKKIYMVPQSWIIDYLKMSKISGEVTKLIENTMENWRVEQTAEGKNLN